MGKAGVAIDSVEDMKILFDQIQVGLLNIAFQEQCNKYLQVLIPAIYGTINENLLSELYKLDFYQKSLDFEFF